MSREGGNFSRPVISKARVDFNIYGPSRTVAHDLAQTVMAVMFREMGQPSPSYDLRIIHIWVETDLLRVDDYLSDSARYLFALRIHFVPYSG